MTYVNELKQSVDEQINMVVNTSCEHITPEQYMQWLNNIPKGTKIVLQSNNYSELEEHVNCSETLDEFVKKSKLNVEVAKELQLTKYKRFMIIVCTNSI